MLFTKPCGRLKRALGITPALDRSFIAMTIASVMLTPAIWANLRVSASASALLTLIGMEAPCR